MALPQPASRTKRIVAPPNGLMPRCTSIWAKRALLAAMRTSVAKRISMPSVKT